MDIHEILKKHWGFSEFRELQEDIINSVLSGNDTLALMPTGGGKSLCFQIPALASDGLCIVVSPLIALMKDQVTNLSGRGIKAAAIYSGMSAREIDLTLDNCVYGNYKFLYVSPERLATEIMQVRAQKMNVNLLAVDEAHCISQWGYDFRPPYLKIAEFREFVPDAPVLAVTATATESVVKDICTNLQFKPEQNKIFRKSFERKNLSYSVLFEEGKYERIVKMLEKVKGTAIVYVRNRRKTKEIAEFLKKKKVSADFYHAGLDHAIRSAKQDDWTKNKTRVMVCTNAFGMGIDKPDVRLVVHADVADNIESYFQEAGRGGRDEKKSFAVLLYNNSDVIDFDERVKRSNPPLSKLRETYQALSNYFQLALGAGENASFSFDIARFSKANHLHPVETLNCLRILELEGYLSLTESVFIPPRLMILVNKEVLYRFEVENKKYEMIIRTLLRAYSGIFDEFVNINEHEIGKFTEMTYEQVVNALRELQHFQLLQYEPQKDAPQVIFLKPRADSETMHFNYTHLEKRREANELRAAAIKSFILNNEKCRSQQLLEYFGEEDAARCGICDVCLKRNQLALSDIEFDQITGQVKKLLSQQAYTISEVIKHSEKFREQQTLKTIQWLLDNEELVLNEKNQLIFRS